MKLLEIDAKTGKMRLSMRALQPKPEGYQEPERRPRGGDRGPRREGERRERRSDDRRGGERRSDRGPRREGERREFRKPRPAAQEDGGGSNNEPEIF